MNSLKYKYKTSYRAFNMFNILDSFSNKSNNGMGEWYGWYNGMVVSAINPPLG